MQSSVLVGGRSKREHISSDWTEAMNKKCSFISDNKQFKWTVRSEHGTLDCGGGCVAAGHPNHPADDQVSRPDHSSNSFSSHLLINIFILVVLKLPQLRNFKRKLNLLSLSNRFNNITKSKKKIFLPHQNLSSHAFLYKKLEQKQLI